MLGFLTLNGVQMHACTRAWARVQEPSEEVRLVLGQTVVLLIRLGSKAISAYAAEVVGFVVAMSEDPFHEVAMQACAAVMELNGGRCACWWHGAGGLAGARVGAVTL